MKKDSRFFGLHFDFHARNDEEIGTRTNSSDIQWYIDEARPEYIQCDCKGHPGNACYPTKVGYPAKLLKEDNLKVWCDTAHKNDLPIYMHYSGLIDERYISEHPEAAKCEENGEVSTTVASPSGDYCDKLLIPQLKELILEYDIDGVWIDGDCWAVYEDFSQNAMPYINKKMSKEELKDFWRNAYLNYLKKYVDELHRFKSDFKIISNWAYSSYMPVKPEIGLDFLSGDVNPVNSVHEIRYEGRCLCAQNKPWDLMSWTFTREGAQKSSVQLMQEAAVILSLGGGYEMYMMQNRDGSACRIKSQKIRQVADFVHDRRLSYEKQPIAQVGVFYSAKSAYKKSRMFNAGGATVNLIGMINCILDSQYTVNVVLDYQMQTLSDYDILVVPEWENIEDEKKQELIEIAKNGGNVVFVGAELCCQIQKLLGINNSTVRTEILRHILDEDGNFALVTGNFFELKDGLEKLFCNQDLRDVDVMSAYSVIKHGNGKITFIPFDLGTNYMEVRSYIIRNFVKRVLTNLSSPQIVLNNKNIDITLQDNGDGVILNLINMNQGRNDLKYCVYDNIPPIYETEVIIHGDFEVQDVLFTDDYEIEIADTYTIVKIKKIDIHMAILLKKQEI